MTIHECCDSVARLCCWFLIVDMDDVVAHMPHMGGCVYADFLYNTMCAAVDPPALLGRMMADARVPVRACSDSLIRWMQALGPKRVLILTARSRVHMRLGTQRQLARLLGEGWDRAHVLYTGDGDLSKGEALAEWCQMQERRKPGSQCSAAGLVRMKACFYDDKRKNCESVAAHFPGIHVVHYKGSQADRAACHRACQDTPTFERELKAYIRELWGHSLDHSLD